MARCSEAAEGFRSGEDKDLCNAVGKGFISRSDWTGIFCFISPHTLGQMLGNATWVEEPSWVCCMEFENSWERVS